MNLSQVIYLVLLLLLSFQSVAQSPGCTDPLANNYNIEADTNDGTCLYPATSLSPQNNVVLSDDLIEISGIVYWNDLLWAHNDDSDTHIYSMNPNGGSILQSFDLEDVVNDDWEEISQDQDYLYIGDFGNNVNGNRIDLAILRIDKLSLLNENPVIDTIHFSYEDQFNLEPTGSNNTDFDCEAFIVSEDSIYLFTKQWINFETSVYSLPKTPGAHIAEYLSTHDVNGLITGAVYMEEEGLIGLCGYSSNLLQPFVYLLYDFSEGDFLSGNKRKINLNILVHQIEGITTEDGLQWFLTNEQVVQEPFINIPPKLHFLDLSEYLDNYLNGPQIGIEKPDFLELISVYPNPVEEYLYIQSAIAPCEYAIFSTRGQIQMQGNLSHKSSRIDVSILPEGLYILRFNSKYESSIKILKR